MMKNLKNRVQSKTLYSQAMGIHYTHVLTFLETQHSLVSYHTSSLRHCTYTTTKTYIQL